MRVAFLRLSVMVWGVLRLGAMGGGWAGFAGVDRSCREGCERKYGGQDGNDGTKTSLVISLSFSLFLSAHSTPDSIANSTIQTRSTVHR